MPRNHTCHAEDGKIRGFTTYKKKEILGAFYGPVKMNTNAVLNAEMAYSEARARLDCVFRNLSDPARAVKHAVLLKQKMDAYDGLTIAKAQASRLDKQAIDRIINRCTQPQKYPNS